VTAHGHGSIHAYARAVAALPRSADPVIVMLEALEEATRTRHARDDDWRIERFVGVAIGDATFLHQLILVLNETAERFIAGQRLAISSIEGRLFDLLSERVDRHRSADTMTLAEPVRNVRIHIAWLSPKAVSFIILAAGADGEG